MSTSMKFTQKEQQILASDDLQEVQKALANFKKLSKSQRTKKAGMCSSQALCAFYRKLIGYNSLWARA